jgi:hypothetical protein
MGHLVQKAIACRPSSSFQLGLYGFNLSHPVCCLKCFSCFYFKPIVLITDTRWYQTNLHPFQRTQDNISPIPHTPSLLSTPLFDPFESLTHPSNRIRHLCHGKVLPQTDSWTSIKWNISPRNRCPSSPSRGVKIVHRRSKEVLAALHDKRTIAAWSSFRNSDRLGLTVQEQEKYIHAKRTSSMWKTGIHQCCANIKWHDGIKTKDCCQLLEGE